MYPLLFSKQAINTDKPAQPVRYQSAPQETPVRSDRPIQNQVVWSAQGLRIDHIEGITSCKHDQIVDCLRGQKMVGSYRNGSYLKACRGAKTVPVNNVMRVLVTPLQNKRGMSVVPESGRSGTAKTAEIRVRFRPEADITSSIF